jgi:hypothetical protein
LIRTSTRMKSMNYLFSKIIWKGLEIMLEDIEIKNG